MLTHGLDYNAPIHQDLNDDGVSLLMAYALDLDPNRNLTASVPNTILDVSKFTMEFYGASAGITYRVEASKNLVDWSDTGIIPFERLYWLNDAEDFRF